MKVITRAVIDKVTFSKDEIKAFKNLRDVINICCNAYSDDYECGSCPFANHCCGDVETWDFLTNIINNFGDGD